MIPMNVMYKVYFVWSGCSELALFYKGFNHILRIPIHLTHSQDMKTEKVLFIKYFFRFSFDLSLY